MLRVSRLQPLLIVLVSATVAILVLALTPRAAQAADDIGLTDGRFFTQTGAAARAGFKVADAGADSYGQTIRFWSEFERLGGVDVLGYPISEAYDGDDGFHYQLFQRGLLQWRPEANRAVLANILDRMSAAGADPWLATLGIPHPVADDNADAIQRRLGWLTEPRIRAWYLSVGIAAEAVERYGLPTSLPARSGPFVIQRFQRTALQLWLEPVPGMPAPGSVVPLLVGELYRDQALAISSPSRNAFQPQPIASVTSYVDDGLQLPLNILATIPSARQQASALRRPGVRVVFEPVPGIGMFYPHLSTVAISPAYREADPYALAAVLAHEGTHLMDDINGVNVLSPDGCLNSELSAYQYEARAWGALYGTSGKTRPASGLDVELNNILSDSTSNPQAFMRVVMDAYRPICGQ